MTSEPTPNGVLGSPLLIYVLGLKCGTLKEGVDCLLCYFTPAYPNGPLHRRVLKPDAIDNLLSIKQMDFRKIKENYSSPEELSQVNVC